MYLEMPKYLAILSPDFVTRNAPFSLRKRIAFTLSSLFIRATGLPTRATDWAISSSSRSLTLTIFSGSSCWGSPVEIRSWTALSTISSLEMS